MAKSFAQQRIERMHQVDQNYREALAIRAQNRETLRGLIAEGDIFSESEVAQIKEVYPDRAPRGGWEDEDLAADMADADGS